MVLFNGKLFQRVSLLTLSFVLAISSVSATTPFLFAQIAGAVGSSEVVYDALPSVMPHTNYSSVGSQAYSMSEFGDYVHLGGSNRILDTVTVTMSDWAKFSDYSSKPNYSGNSTSWSMPITLNVYSSHLGTNGAPDTLLATANQTFSIPWRPESDPTCALTGNGYGWKEAGVCYNYSGIASNITFDFSSIKATLPNDVILGVAYNTQSHGYAPTGVAGPYDSLNVAVPDSQTVSVGSDDSTNNLFWNTSHAPFYTDGGAGGTNTFRQDTDWSPYATVAFKVTATSTNTAPTVSFVSSTPVADSYVHGTINPHVLASDDYGMGSYYIRLWKNAFESGTANLVSNNCSSAPGAFNLGTSQDVICAPIDTTLLVDGKYVLSAQFLDGNQVWGSSLRTLYVDNHKPNISIKTGTGVDDGSKGKDGIYSQISFKLNDPSGGLGKAILNGHEYTRTNEWNDLNWVNITKADLVEGTNTIYVIDRAGNQSDPLTFIYDKTAPVAQLLVTPVSATGNFVSGSVVISGTTSADTDHYYLVVKDHTGKVVYGPGAVPGATIHDLTWDTSAKDSLGKAKFVDGTYTIDLEVRDKADNKGAASVATKIVTVDNTAPAVTVLAPTGAITTGSVKPNVTATDINSPLTYLWSADSTNPAILSFDKTVAEPTFTPTVAGTYGFILVTTDTLGNSTTSRFGFTYAPIVALGTAATNTGTPTPVPAVNFVAADTQAQPAADNLGTPEVLGTQTKADATDTAATPEVKGASTQADQASGWALAWYWWVLIIAAVASFIWWLIARRRNLSEA